MQLTGFRAPIKIAISRYAPVSPVVTIILEFLVASSPSRDEMTPFAEIEIVELILPNECLS
jgi:hypothetical protein